MTKISLSTWPKLRIGISSCLLGNRVRHNGEHKANDWILTQLNPWVTWVPVCPEVEMGLGVPRKTLRLIGSLSDPKLITVATKEDHTEVAHKTIERMLSRNLDLDGFIFKKDSPSCGLQRVKVYGPSGIPIKEGVGLFAKAARAKYQNIPMTEEGRLSDPAQREAFLIQIYIFSRFTRLRKSTRSLQEFHQVHKLQLMAYDPGKYQLLGRLAANPQKRPASEVFPKYESLLCELLSKTLTPKKYVNVFQHILGYFKKHLDSKEKTHLLNLIEDYKMGKIPLISVSTLFDFLVKKHAVPYLENQTFLTPYPREILTRAPY